MEPIHWIEQVDNPAARRIVELTGMEMVAVSPFWRETVARAELERLDTLTRFTEIKERFPILTSVSRESPPSKIFSVAHRIHAEVKELLGRLPEGSRNHFQKTSSKDIINSPSLFLELVQIVPPIRPFYKRIFDDVREGIYSRISSLNLQILDDDGHLPEPACCHIQ